MPPIVEEVTDARLNEILDVLRLRKGGAFSNYSVMVEEVRSMAIELLRRRDKPLHCPCYDGDHL